MEAVDSPLGAGSGHCSVSQEYPSGRPVPGDGPMETPEDLQSWGYKRGAENELCRASPTRPRCPQLEEASFPPSSASSEEEAGLESPLRHQTTTWSTPLCHVLGQGVPQSPGSCHSLCLPLPACSNPTQSLHALLMVSGYIPQQWLAPYLQPELLYLLQHRGLLVPAAREKPVTNSLQTLIFLQSLRWRALLFQRTRSPHHNQVTPGLPGLAPLWEDEEPSPTHTQSRAPHPPWDVPIR